MVHGVEPFFCARLFFSRYSWFAETWWLFIDALTDDNLSWRLITITYPYRLKKPFNTDEDFTQNLEFLLIALVFDWSLIGISSLWCFYYKYSVTLNNDGAKLGIDVVRDHFVFISIKYSSTRNHWKCWTLKMHKIIVNLTSNYYQIETNDFAHFVTFCSFLSSLSSSSERKKSVLYVILTVIISKKQQMNTIRI